MATIFNREIDGVTVSYDTELKNQLGDQAVAESTKKAMGRQAVYTFAVGSGTAAFVKLDKETVEEFGEASELDTSKKLKKISEGIYYVVEPTSWSEVGSETIKLTFANKKTLKLDIIKVEAGA